MSSDGFTMKEMLIEVRKDIKELHKKFDDRDNEFSESKQELTETKEMIKRVEALSWGVWVNQNMGKALGVGVVLILLLIQETRSLGLTGLKILLGVI